MNDEHDCHCDDPRHEGRKLWLCGTELCKRLTDKAYRNGLLNGVATVINDDGPEE